MKKFKLTVLNLMLISTTVLGPLPALAVEDEQTSEATIETITEFSENGIEDLILTPDVSRSSEDESEVGTRGETRAVKEVGTFAELLSALRTASVTEIMLTNNITATSNIDNLPVRDIKIYGNQKTLTMGTYTMTNFFVGTGSLSFENMTFRGVPGGDPVIMNVAQTWNINFNNVTIDYARLNLSKSSVFFAGTNKMNMSVALSGALIGLSVTNLTIEQGSTLAIKIPTPSAGKVITGVTGLALEGNAQLLIGQDADLPTTGTSEAIGDFTSISLATGSLVKLRTTDIGIRSKANLVAEPGSVIDAVSKSYGLYLTGGSFYFSPGTTLRASGGTQGISGHGKVNLNQPKEFLIESTGGNEVVRSNAALSALEVTFTQVDLSAWNRATNPTAPPNLIWESLDHKSTIKAATTTLISSNNEDAKTKIKYNLFRKINGVGSGYISEVTVSVNTITDQDKVITGTATPGADLTVVIGSDKYTGQADSNGKFQINIGKTYPANTEVKVNGTLNGISKDTVLVIKDLTPPAKPSLNSLNDQSREVSGKAEAGATVVIKQGETVLGEGVADGNGNFLITIPAQTEGTKLTATVIDESGNKSTESTVVVTGTKLADPVFNAVSDNDGLVTGKAPANALVTLSIPQAAGGTMSYSGTADSMGNFSIPIAKQAAGTTINGVATLGGKTSGTVSLTVIDKTAPAKPTIEALNDQSTAVKGKAEANSTVTLKVNGQVIGSGKVDSSGNYHVTIPKQAANTVVVVTATDQNGNQSPTNQTTVIKVVTAGTLTANDYILLPTKESNLTGKVTGDIKSLGYSINGVLATGGTLNSDGTFKIYILNKIKSKEDKVIVFGYDQYGKQISQVSVKIVDKNDTSVGTGSITPNVFTVKKDTYLTGTVTGGVTSIRLVVDGTPFNGGTLNGDGTFKFYALRTITSKNQTVVIEAYDKNGNKISSKPVVVKDTTDTQIGKGTVKGNEFVIGRDSQLTGTYTGDVHSLIVTINGVEYKGGTLNSDGTFKFYAWDKIKAKVPVTVDGYDKNGNHVATSAVVVKNLSDISGPTVGNLILSELVMPGDTHIKGSYTGDVASVATIINGVEQKGGTLSNGQLSIYIWGKVKSVRDIVQVVAYDKQGKELSRKNVTIKASTIGTGGLKATTYKIGTSNLTGEYTGDVKSIKVSINGTIYSGGTVKDGTYSFYIFRKITALTDDVKVTGYDANGLKLNESKVTITQ
ncbi:immunoglobulin-like domain-containing protein [uncultured Vagococcus sp.]|uniref:immunoglobulin-like domain-containing protein n=1 Tax=uncultured Vagococcus sp. TaxID=189676 RepID=UPI0028D5EB34|nr:immunoglobulin-like domain-containing protein [uncultured Vagococcus sp.]